MNWKPNHGGTTLTNMRTPRHDHKGDKTIITKMKSIYFFYNKVITHFTGRETNTKKMIILQAHSTFNTHWYKIFCWPPDQPLERFTIFDTK